MRLSKIGMQLEGDADVIVMWKRGPQEDCTNSFEMNDIQDEIDVDFQFKRVSTFYRNNKGNYEKKLCEFHLYREDDGAKKLIGKEDFDMSPFVGYNEKPCTIEFNSAIYSNCFIEVIWSINETDGDKKEQNMLAR